MVKGSKSNSGSATKQVTKITLSSEIKKLFYSSREFARLADVSERTVNRWREARRITAYRLSERKYRYRIQDVEEFLNRRRIESES